MDCKRTTRALRGRLGSGHSWRPRLGRGSMAASWACNSVLAMAAVGRSEPFADACRPSARRDPLAPLVNDRSGASRCWWDSINHASWNFLGAYDLDSLE
jgi:hypothetical protein